jgi:hypothetical protein
MVAGLKQRGIPFGYFLFDGEQHGFRNGENIKRCLDAELYFYAALLLRPRPRRADHAMPCRFFDCVPGGI